MPCITALGLACGPYDLVGPLTDRSHGQHLKQHETEEKRADGITHSKGQVFPRVPTAPALARGGVWSRKEGC